MNILWVTNQPVLSGNLKGSGTWLEATLDILKMNENVHVFIASLSAEKYTRIIEKNDVTQIYIPNRRGTNGEYLYNSADSKKDWSDVLDLAKPDLITLWGTEYAHGMTVVELADEIPCVVYMQGVMKAISRCCLGELSFNECKHIISLRDLIKRDTLLQRQKKYNRAAWCEEQIIKKAKRVIVDNKWAASICLSICPECRVYYNHLPVKQVFFENEWNPISVENKTLMCTASGSSPLKGLHILLRALKIVKGKYPDILLKIPGMEPQNTNGFMSLLRQGGYAKYIYRVIREYGLEDNVQFLGRLSSEQVMSELVRSSLFVMPSSIENHSISLREAMAVGIPCISSYVGGIPELLKNGENAWLFRSGDYELLALEIIQALENGSKMNEIGRSGHNTIVDFYQNDSPSLIDIYESVIAEKEVSVNI